MSRLELWQLNAARRIHLYPLGQGQRERWSGQTLTTIPVPANKEAEYFAGSVSGSFRARISTPVTGGTVTVLAIRPEEQKGSSFLPLAVGFIAWLDALSIPCSCAPTQR
jgi:hypothetical protein